VRPSGAAAVCPRPMQVVTSTATQSFQLRGNRARQWCGSSYSIRIPSLTFVGRPVANILADFRSRR